MSLHDHHPNDHHPNDHQPGQRHLDEQLLDAVCAAALDRAGPTRRVVAGLVAELAPLATDDELGRLTRRAVARLEGLDVLDLLLDDPSVDEVMVNRGSEVWVDRGGRLTSAGRLPAGLVDTVLERTLAPLGRRLDRTNPVVDARLPDGARLCAVVAPAVVDGTAVAIRRHRPASPGLDAFAEPGVVALLRRVLATRANVLVTGATSAGKTTFLATLLAELGDERLVVIEDTAELALEGRHAVRLETRPPAADGPGPIDAAQLVRTSLRLRPDRLIVGEFRGPEALAIVEALNTGHDGSLSTCHANSAIDGLRRLETLVMQAVPAWPLAAIRRQVTRSIDVIVHLRRHADGSRRIAEIVEVVEGDDEPAGRHLACGDVVRAECRRGRR